MNSKMGGNMSESKIKVIMKEFEIHTTPLEELVMCDYKIIVELDDINEKRHKILFKPFQAVKITTVDCTKSPDYFNEYSFRNGRYQRYILVIEDSDWIEQLKKDFTDKRAKFLNEAIHYVLPLQDNIIEIVAHNIEVQKVN